jgi:hypothetical protein
MSVVSFRTRKRGTARQIGTKFPILEKKRLPPKISMRMPSFKNNATGISDVTYSAPALDKDGSVSFNFGSDVVQAVVKLVPREEAIGQWDINKPIVYLDNKVPMPWQKSLAIHEALERHLEKKYGIPWNEGGHLIADEVEKRLFLQSRSLKEWKDYTKTVRFFSEMNRAGGKTGHDKVDLEKAFDLLSQKQRSLKWQERGLNSILAKETEALEAKEFGDILRGSIDKLLAAEKPKIGRTKTRYDFSTEPRDARDIEGFRQRDRWKRRAQE